MERVHSGMRRRSGVPKTDLPSLETDRFGVSVSLKRQALSPGAFIVLRLYCVSLMHNPDARRQIPQPLRTPTFAARRLARAAALDRRISQAASAHESPPELVKR